MYSDDDLGEGPGKTQNVAVGRLLNLRHHHRWQTIATELGDWVIQSCECGHLRRIRAILDEEAAR